MRKRTQAREIAFQALYQHDVHQKIDETAPSTVDDFETFIAGATDDVEVRKYARILVDGTIAMRQNLDERITQAAKNWKLSRIAPVDRSILRLALFEMLGSEDVPPKVAINEAIDLAKRYSTEQSGAFVNGILDRIYNEIRKQ